MAKKKSGQEFYFFWPPALQIIEGPGLTVNQSYIYLIFLRDIKVRNTGNLQTEKQLFQQDAYAFVKRNLTTLEHTKKYL